jgi:hypothetical protein
VPIEDISIPQSDLLDSPLFTHRPVNLFLTGRGRGRAAGTVIVSAPGLAELAAGIWASRGTKLAFV